MEDEQSLKPRNLAKIRKRARVACLSCRARKVRCDVSRRGRPCMNCSLDSESCIVTGKATKYHTDGRGLLPSAPSKKTGIHETVDEVTLASGSEDEMSSHHQDRHWHGPMLRSATPPLLTNKHDHSCQSVFSMNTGSRDFNLIPSTSKGKQPRSTEAAINIPRVANILEYIAQHSTLSPTYQVLFGGRLTTLSDVVYCHYQFLTVPNIRTIPHQDVNFLEDQGCFRVPIRPLLDDFIRQYFLHVHTILPILNEGNFSDIFYAPNHTMPQHVSLLLLQAMLFAACTFVSPSTIKALEFPNIRYMRATFLRRTKLLYDLRTESSPLVIAQAALLLTFASVSSSKIPNTLWLNIAIENAKLAEAHRYTTMDASSRSDYKILKRIWWCCIIRDRSIGLLLRRPIQITHNHFDFNDDPLEAKDFSDELHRSRVYNTATKRSLANILTIWIKLYIRLTDILLLTFPLQGSQSWDPANRRQDCIRLGNCKTSLKRWYEFASLRLPTPTANSRRDAKEGNDLHDNTNYETTALYTNLMYMYYHTARINLCHYEMLHLDFLQADTDVLRSLSQNLSTILENRNQLQDSISGITKHHEELTRLGLTKWLPISVIGCIVMPLILNILDIALLNTISDVNNQTAILEHKDGIILFDAMKTYWPQYDGMDWIAEIAHHIITTIDLDKSKINLNNSSINWTDILIYQPISYLRVALTIDLCLSNGRLPQDRDFPRCLSGSLAATTPCVEDTIRCHCSNQGGSSSNYDTTSTSIPQRIFSNRPTSPDSSIVPTDYPFGLDEAFIGNLEEQIFWHIANGFPDNGMFQFMDVGMSNSSPPWEEESLSGSTNISDGSIFAGAPSHEKASCVTSTKEEELATETKNKSNRGYSSVYIEEDGGECIDGLSV